MIKLAIVILNWNGIEYLRRFLPEVKKYSESEQNHLWIADNGSSDGSLKFLEDRFPDVRVLKFDKNYGFAGGYNKAFAEINAEYYILLNSDVQVTPGWTEPLIRLMDNDTNVAACMPKIRDITRRDYFEYAGAAGGFIDFLGYPFCRGRIFDVIEKDHGQYDDEREVFWATGACMIVRGTHWHAAGGLDKKFFAHMEEIDLCWRLKNAGRKIMVCPSSVVYHLGGGTLPPYHPRKVFLNFRNSLLMLAKNLPRRRLWLILIRLGLDWISVMKFISAFSFANAFAVVKAHFAFFGQLINKQLKKRAAGYLSDPSSATLSGGTAGNQSRAPEMHPEMYRRSIVIDFFIKGRRVFSRLRFGG
ncbi:MAG: glycosyltransferase family 2 protein [Bacteroidales bacterium]